MIDINLRSENKLLTHSLGRSGEKVNIDLNLETRKSVSNVCVLTIDLGTSSENCDHVKAESIFFIRFDWKQRKKNFFQKVIQVLKKL